MYNGSNTFDQYERVLNRLDDMRSNARTAAERQRIDRLEAMADRGYRSRMNLTASVERNGGLANAFGSRG